MVNLVTVVQIVTAIGTVALAVSAFLSSYISRRQVLMAAEQNLEIKKQNFPVLRVSQIKFNKNELEVSMTNIGNSPATLIGVSVNYFPARRTILTEEEADLPAGSEKSSTGFYQRYDYNSQPLYYEAKRAYFHPVVVFPKHADIEKLYLGAKEKAIYKFDILIQELDNKEEMESLTGKYFDMIEFRNFLESNGHDCAGIVLSLTGKDLNENSIDETPLGKFIYDLETDKNLEEAYNRKHSIYFLPLSHKDMFLNSKFVSKWVYDNMMSSKKSEELYGKK